MTLFKIGLAVLTAIAILSSGMAFSEEMTSGEPGGLGARANMEGGFVERKQNEITTQSTVTKHAINILGTPAQTSIYKPLDLLPSVHVETADPFGLTTRLLFNIRVRGQAGIGLSTMVEGVPVWAVEQPGPRADIFDLENIQSLTLYRGGVPPDKGLGAGNTAGALDIPILKPREKFGVTAVQSFGSYDFLRSFIRLDSGKLPTDTKLFGSFSYSAADKWKGDGGAPDYRNHLSFGATQRFSPAVTAELYTDYNVQKFHAFKPLTFAQTKDLSTFYKADFNKTLTGRAATDIDYYDYNREKAENLSLIGSLAISATAPNSLTFRPYYWSENRPVLSGLANIPGSTPATPGIRERANDFDRFGNVLEYKTVLAGANITAGYWYESFDFPIKETYYRIASNGSLVFDRTLLGQPDGRGTIHSPYVRALKDFNDFHFDLGLRYLYLDNPGQVVHLSTGPDDPANNYTGAIQREWLPFGGLSYSLDPTTSIYTSYGRNYARPHGYPELMQTFIGAKTAFTNAGVNMQYLFDRINLVTSDNYELGMRFNGKRFYVVPSIFYAEYSNKLLSVFDPVAQRPIRQSVGKSRVYGGELEADVIPCDNLRVFGSFSFNRSELTEDMRTAAGTVVKTAGKQTPDTPQYLAKLGLTYSLYDLDISPVARYVDSRYGDAANNEQIPSYMVVDLNLTYKFRPFLGIKEPFAGLSVLNLLNKEYIAVVNAFEDSLSGTYLPGAPLTVIFGVGAKF